MAVASLSPARLRELVFYDPETGAFHRQVRTAQRHAVGDRADFPIRTGPMKGYLRVGIDSRRYLAHRLAWLYVHGEWPAQDIDHIDGDRGNNRIANLRDVSNDTNRQNMTKARVNNATGLLGAHQYAPGRWRARVYVKGKAVNVGCFDSPEKAHEAYIQAKRRLHEGCTL